MSYKLDFNINPDVFKSLLKLQSKLPEVATGSRDPDGEHAYEQPAGMALLGMKDGELNSVAPLRMTGGCWDAPNISHTDMDKGFRELIDSGHTCVGMALYRHPKWHSDMGDQEADAKMPVHLRYQLHTMRNAFADITKTAWIILHNNYFRVYSPTKGTDGRIGCREVPVNRLLDEEAKKDTFIKSKLDRDKGKSARVAAKKAAREAEEKARAEWRAAEAERRRIANAEARARELAEEEKQKAVAKAKIARAAKKVADVNAKLKEGKDALIEAGNGMVFMKGKDGQYILWKV